MPVDYRCKLQHNRMLNFNTSTNLFAIAVEKVCKRFKFANKYINYNHMHLCTEKNSPSWNAYEGFCFIPRGWTPLSPAISKAYLSNVASCALRHGNQLITHQVVALHHVLCTRSLRHNVFVCDNLVRYGTSWLPTLPLSYSYRRRRHICIDL